MSGDGSGEDGDGEDSDDGSVEYGLEDWGEDEGDVGAVTDTEGTGSDGPTPSTGGGATGPGAGGDGGTGGKGPPEWSGGDPSSAASEAVSETVGGDGELLDPDSTVDNTLTVVVGIVAGLVIGVVGMFTLLFLTGSSVGFLLGLVAWLGSTAYLVRRQSVLGAVAHGAYGVAIVLLLIPFIMASPAVDAGGASDRLVAFVFLLVSMAIPASVVAGVGYFVSRYVPDGGSDG